MNERIGKISNWLKENHVDMALVSSTPNVFYLSNFLCHPHERLLALFVFPDQEPFLVCPEMEILRARSAGWQGNIISFDDVENPWQKISNELAKRGLTENVVVAIEKEQLTYHRLEALQSIITVSQIQSVDETLNQMRLIKDEKEIQALREAARFADVAIQLGIDSLCLGCTELEVLAHIELGLKKQGIREMSFSTMVLFGENAALPHGEPGSRALKEGDLVLFDLGVIVDGYCSDITRTVAFQHVNEQQKKIYETVLKAQQSAVEACRPEVRMGEIDRIPRSIISEAGYGEYFPHRIGHGLGISVHEFPSIIETDDSRLEPGMVFTIEPGIYVPEIAGVRIEDDILITEEGCEILTQFPKELLIVR
ncbi:M24 family metallopeptidase [Hazenella coriacea]|uniref:Xaa-Pro aminopeptidase n=1 Tax=Hazenella coriacea TaxID=1179467 RepID=A0A4R3L6U3_9BACL|nr:Xaa-Pro peptidase family protein [Hazenella coriacea]TCS94808.1 Xaa-Pro aminopeptidase [Hazenella coriacea]